MSQRKSYRRIGEWQWKQNMKEYSCGYNAGQKAREQNDVEKYRLVQKSSQKKDPWELGFIKGWKDKSRDS